VGEKTELMLLRQAFDELGERLERLESAAPKPEPVRFVPTEPGWYWLRSKIDGKPSPAWWEPGYAPGSLQWLAPVAPYVEARTEEEARREPRRGDRWKAAYSPLHYTLIAPRNDGIPTFWSGIWSDRPASVSYGFDPGRPGETYLGNFAHELEAP